MQIWLFLLLGLRLAARTSATQAKCTVNNWRWAFNSIDHGPCWVTSELNKVCNGPVFEMMPQDATMYAGPSSQSNCMCNLVMYNLLRVCTMCQGKSTENWDAQIYKEWAVHCNSQTVIDFPGGNPPGEVIPGWAYKGDVGGEFNLDMIKKAAAAAPASSSSTQTASSKASSPTSGSVSAFSKSRTSTSNDRSASAPSTRLAFSGSGSAPTNATRSPASERGSSTQTSASSTTNDADKVPISGSSSTTESSSARPTLTEPSQTATSDDRSAGSTTAADDTTTSELSTAQLSSLDDVEPIDISANGDIVTDQKDFPTATSVYADSSKIHTATKSIIPSNLDEVFRLPTLAELFGFDEHDSSDEAAPPARIATIAGGICGAVALAGLAAGLLLWYRRRPNKDGDEVSFVSRNDGGDDAITVSSRSAYDSEPSESASEAPSRLAGLGAIGQNLLNRVKRPQTIKSFVGGHAPRDTMHDVPPLPSIPQQYMMETSHPPPWPSMERDVRPDGSQYYDDITAYSVQPSHLNDNHAQEELSAYSAFYQPSVSQRGFEKYDTMHLDPFALEAEGRSAYGPPPGRATRHISVCSDPQSVQGDDVAISQYAGSSSSGSRASQLPLPRESGIPIMVSGSNGPLIKLHPPSTRTSRQSSAAGSVQRKKHWI